MTLLEVFDIGRSVAFYRSLGFDVVAHWADAENVEEWDWVHLRLGDAELMLNSRYERDERPPVPDASRAGGHADTELFFSCTDLEALRESIRSSGLPAPEPETTSYGARRFCLADPDGFLIWFQAPQAAGEKRKS